MFSSKIFAGASALVVSLLAATSAAAPAAACQNPQGLQWSIYPNPFTNQQDPTYKKFNPTYIKTQVPFQQGVTSYVGLDIPYSYAYFYPYGGSEYTSDEHFIIDHRGYIHATMTGIYNFTITADDEIVLLWLHSLAYSGWTRKNAREVAAFDDVTYTPTVPVTFSFRLSKGTYTPIRFVWANNNGPVSLEAQLTDPLGNVLLGANSAPNKAIVQYACSGTKAPPFQPYGQEQ